VVASGPGISITGGHGDLNNFSPQTRVMMFPEERDFALADNVDQIRHVIRSQEKYGVDVIKILATGGVLSKGDNPGSPQFTLEELKAAAETAHMGGRKIAAHAHGAEGIKNAIRAGIDSIEHGSLIDAEGIRLAKEHGTYLVMDIYNDEYILNEAPKWGLPTENLDKERMVGRLQRENFRKAFQAGVTHFMTEHPEAQARMQTEAREVVGNAGMLSQFADAERLKYIEAMTLETMRLKPVAPVLFLEALEDVEIGGVAVPKQTAVFLLTLHSGLQHNHFGGADQFRPERWLEGATSPGCPHNAKAFVPFGAGPRFCPGRQLALVEIKTVMAMLCSTFEVSKTPQLM
jgi:hypothetical protein